jgi:XTP/dITP diphosphohydrolase
MGIALKRGDRVVLASHNEGKVHELAELLVPFGIGCVSAKGLEIPEPDETGVTFSDNAKLKAVAAAHASGMTAIADDSGLEVAALDGAPGIHSARWGGEAKDFGLAMRRVHQELEARGAREPRANFICSLALATPEGAAQSFEGRVFGALVWPPRGTRGFGYDPIFLPDGYQQTFGEMEREFKNRLSHRMRAFEQLIAASYVDET